MIVGMKRPPSNTTGAVIYTTSAIRGGEVEEMLFVMWYEFDPDHTTRVIELWKSFKFPSEVKVLHRYLLIGRHMSAAIFEAPNEESLLKITLPFSSFGVAHIVPAMTIEDAIKQM
ncbi:DUF3303 domain-containing protein [Methanogenium cariaci]